MEQRDMEKFVSILTCAAEVNGRPLSPESIKLWWNLMRGVSLADFERAMSRCLERSDRMPVPANVLRLVRGAPADPKELATLAWGKVEKAISNIGQYQSVCFDDPVIHLAITLLGGWPKVCRSADGPFLRKDFESAYTACHGDVGRRGLEDCGPYPVLVGEHASPTPAPRGGFRGDLEAIARWHAAIGAPVLPALADLSRPQIEGATDGR